MWKVRIFLLAIALFIVFLIYNLPTVVVKNPEPTDSIQALSRQLTPAPSEILEKRALLREYFLNSDEKQKSAIFADSLATLYAESEVYDSAAWYLEWIAENTGDHEALLKAGNLYYNAFETAPTKEEAGQYGVKSRNYLDQYLEHYPGNAEAKTKAAMTFVGSEEPMKGIGLLMEVAKEHPDYEPAIFNLGLLSMQSSQFDKAIERFERLVELNPDHVTAIFYLAVSYMEAGRKSDAKANFLKTIELSDDQEIITTAENYLQKLK